MELALVSAGSYRHHIPFFVLADAMTNGILDEWLENEGWNRVG
jgi:hypothetical protein